MIFGTKLLIYFINFQIAKLLIKFFLLKKSQYFSLIRNLISYIILKDANKFSILFDNKI